MLFDDLHGNHYNLTTFHHVSHAYLVIKADMFGSYVMHIICLTRLNDPNVAIYFVEDANHEKQWDLCKTSH